MQVADNVLSRKGHYLHEGTPTEYTQVRELYQHVLTPKKRDGLHYNTARLLKVSIIIRFWSVGRTNVWCL